MSYKSEYSKSGHKVEDIWLTNYAELLTLLLVFFAIIISSSSISNVKFEQVQETFQDKKKVQQEANTQQTISKIKENIKNKISAKNMQEYITVIEDESSIALIFKDNLLFDLGKTDIKEENRKIIDEFVLTFKDLPSHAHIAIEGHTDDNPVSTGVIRSNWHLSSMRALSVLEVFESHQLCKGNCELRGYGEFRPFKPNRDENGVSIDANQSQNRRVVIRIY